MFSIAIHKRIKQILKVFHLFDVWRKNEDASSALSKHGWKLKYLIVQVSFALSLIVGGLLSEDKNEFVYLIDYGLAISILSAKMTLLIYKKERIRKFLLDIGAQSVADHEEFKKINNKIKKFMVFSSGYMIMSLGACVAVNIVYLPVFSSERRLPFNIWFPLDWRNNTTAYWMAYVFVAIGIAISYIATLLNVIIWYLMMNCAIKYQILGNQFRNIGTAKPTAQKREISEAEKERLFLQELVCLIKTHQNIQKTTDTFKSCFANVFFAKITTSAFCICGTVYVLAFGNHGAKLVQIMITMVMLCYHIFDIFMVMYFGNEIKLSSDQLSYCLFESNWMERSQSYKKSVIILTEVLKKPHELLIGKLYRLDLKTFTSIINLTYSMFNILQKFN